MGSRASFLPFRSGQKLAMCYSLEVKIKQIWEIRKGGLKKTGQVTKWLREGG